MREQKLQEQARIVSDMLNNMSFDYKGFCLKMSGEHRTLQQNFTRLCLEWFKLCASEDYWTDGRNEASQQIAREIGKALEEVYGIEFERLQVPFI